ncbi:hypothetical protein KR009_012193 [Drosophila setifemur]|nr:hypothetical protein KR009_012193 [Drosophila setifemur]
MNRFRGDPLLQVAKCEMCPHKARHLVTGLCDRCQTIWIGGKRNLDMTQMNLNNVRAALVAAQTQSESKEQDPTFRAVIEQERIQRRQKVELFQKVRNQFQDSVLIEPFYDKKPLLDPDEEYWNVPAIINDPDVVMFQHEVNLVNGVENQTIDDHDHEWYMNKD